jgi:hypothetical protein
MKRAKNKISLHIEHDSFTSSKTLSTKQQQPPLTTTTTANG